MLTLECSLFGLLNRTVTKSGGSMLRRWMLTPLVSSMQINARLRAVAYFSSTENDELRQQLVTSRNLIELCFFAASNKVQFGKLKQFRDVAGIFSASNGVVLQSVIGANLQRLSGAFRSTVSSHLFNFYDIMANCILTCTAGPSLRVTVKQTARHSPMCSQEC